MKNKNKNQTQQITRMNEPERQTKPKKSITPNNLWLILNELNVKASWIFYQNIMYRLALGNMNQREKWNTLANYDMHLQTKLHLIQSLNWTVYTLRQHTTFSESNYFWCASCHGSVFNFHNKYSNLIWIFRVRLSQPKQYHDLRLLPIH